jgi:hypothetical protein
MKRSTSDTAVLSGIVCWVSEGPEKNDHEYYSNTKLAGIRKLRITLKKR